MQRHTRFPLALALTVVVAAVAACDDGAGSERGVYVLRTVGDSTVPFDQYEAGDYRVITVADTIVLDGRGGSRETSVSRIETANQPGTNSSYSAPRRYAMRGDTVEFVYTCPPGAACVLQLAGYELVTGGMATFALYPQYPIAVSFFERVR